jgi:hypothetical protein
MATGGDEFVLYLKGKTPLSQELIEQIVMMFQKDISASEELRKHLDFSKESVLKQYGMPSSAQRKIFEDLPAEGRALKLAEIRATLPDQFIPSFSGGGALLSDGILRAIEKDDDDLEGEDETFHSLREKIVQGTIEVAEDRQKKNKESELKRLALTDRKTYEFRLRNQENRRLLAEKDALEAQLHETRTRLDALLGLEQADKA